MTIKLKKIILSNFRSYQGEHTFVFPTEPGLYFFAGKNEANTSLGANGAGKSTFLDAITWVLFGYTSRGLKAGDILPWDTAETASVALLVTIGDQEAWVTRTQRPNSLLLDDKAVDQVELEKFLRINFESFMHSVLFPQFGAPFFSLSPSGKLTLFSDIMNLSVWLDLSKAANQLTTEIGKTINEFQTDIAMHTGKISIIEADILQLKEQSKFFELDKAERVFKVKEETRSLYKKYKKAEQGLAKFKAEENIIKQDITQLEKSLSGEKNSIRMYLSRMDEVSFARSGKKAEILKYQEQLDSLKRNRTCPTCRHTLTDQERIKSFGEMTAIVDRCKSDLDQSRSLTAEYTRAIAMTKNNISATTDKLDAEQTRLHKLMTTIRENERVIDTTNAQLDNIGERLVEAEMAVDPNKEMGTSKEAKLVKLKKQLQDDTATLYELQADFESASYWIRGFKRVRLFIIEQAFQTLEIEVNNALAQLGLTEWSITFDIERENKGGGVTKGFVTFIKSPYNKTPVKWENWSGGETQRLQLAGDLALANLIMQQSGLSNTIEFFDEPSHHLSPEGVLDLASMLHERAISEGKCIWIADHTAITNFGKFEGIITARKTENGSSITIGKTTD